MCGINGIFAYNAAASAPDKRELIATRDAMARRGPDGAGEWWDASRRIGMGHRRLALLDLSDAGAQPMVSRDSRYVITFNGEIYNFPALRAELERDGVRFHSGTDTEVILALYAREGERMLRRLRGMFAFAIWDCVDCELFLARDPYGIKPLYISNDGWTFRFASQVRALLAGGGVSRAPEPAGIVGFHIWGSVPEPFTLYRDIEALPPGASLRVTAAGPGRPRTFASIRETFVDGAASPAPERELRERIASGVRESVQSHMLADVDVGIFLSGGVDSCALLGLMAEQGGRRPRALTLSFSEYAGTSDDEAPLAAAVARVYGVDHIVRRVDEEEFQRDLPHILEAMDQPSIDGVNTWFVSKAAREAGLKAVISGVGGDELLAGYSSFVDIPKIVRLARLPASAPGLGLMLRGCARALGLARETPKWASVLEYGGTYAGAYLLRRGLFLPFELQAFMDRDFVTRGLERLGLMDGLRDADPGRACPAVSRVAALESQLYLRNQLLRDADWAGMAHSIEIRTPLVDYSLLETIAPVVPWLVNSGAGKATLASAPRQSLPSEIVMRGKTGFGVPVGYWLHGASTQTRRLRGLASRAWSRQVFASLGDVPTAGRVAA